MVFLTQKKIVWCSSPQFGEVLPAVAGLGGEQLLASVTSWMRTSVARLGSPLPVELAQQNSAPTLFLRIVLISVYLCYLQTWVSLRLTVSLHQDLSVSLVDVSHQRHRLHRRLFVTDCCFAQCSQVSVHLVLQLPEGPLKSAAWWALWCLEGSYSTFYLLWFSSIHFENITKFTAKADEKMFHACADFLTQSSSEHRETLDSRWQCCFLCLWKVLPSLRFSSLTQTAHEKTKRHKWVKVIWNLIECNWFIKHVSELWQKNPKNSKFQVAFDNREFSPRHTSPSLCNLPDCHMKRKRRTTDRREPWEWCCGCVMSLVHICHSNNIPSCFFSTFVHTSTSYAVKNVLCVYVKYFLALLQIFSSKS